MKSLLVIIPVFNEAMNIKGVIEDVRSEFNNADILVIDDCSTDNTLEVVKDMDVKYLSLPFNLGYSSALQTGFKYAIEENYDYVIQFDGDGQHIASEGKKLFEAVKENNCDIVIGSRFIDKTSYENTLLRKLGSKVFKVIIHIICRRTIHDPTSGFQLLSRRVFEKYSRMHNYPDYPDANLIIEMLLDKYKVIEISTAMKQREHGISMHDGLLGPLKYMVNMLFSIFIVFIKYFPISFIRLIKKKI